MTVTLTCCCCQLNKRRTEYKDDINACAQWERTWTELAPGPSLSRPANSSAVSSASRPGRPAHQYFWPRPSGRRPYRPLGSLGRHNEASARGMRENALPCTPTSTSSATSCVSFRHVGSTSSLRTPLPPSFACVLSSAGSNLPNSTLCFIPSAAWYHWRSPDKKQILPMTPRQIYGGNARAPVSLCTDLIKGCDAPPPTSFCNDSMLL